MGSFGRLNNVHSERNTEITYVVLAVILTEGGKRSELPPVRRFSGECHAREFGAGAGPQGSDVRASVPEPL